MARMKVSAAIRNNMMLSRASTSGRTGRSERAEELVIV